MIGNNQNSVCQDQAMARRAIPSSIDELDRALIALESTLYALHAQLNPVLDSQDMAEGSVFTKSPDPLHYAVQIADMASRVRDLTNLGSGIISRLHV